MRSLYRARKCNKDTCVVDVFGDVLYRGVGGLGAVTVSRLWVNFCVRVTGRMYQVSRSFGRRLFGWYDLVRCLKPSAYPTLFPDYGR